MTISTFKRIRNLKQRNYLETPRRRKIFVFTKGENSESYQVEIPSGARRSIRYRIIKLIDEQKEYYSGECKTLRPRTHQLKFAESRLDVLLIRLSFSTTIPEARLLIRHRAISVDHQIITNPDFLVPVGSMIRIHLCSPYHLSFFTSKNSFDIVPDYLIRFSDFKGLLINSPPLLPLRGFADSSNWQDFQL